MAPNSASTVTGAEEPPVIEESPQQTKIVWLNVALFVYLHATAIYGVYLGLTEAKSATIIFTLIFGNLGGLGITAGSHRLWSHRSYKAKWPLRVFLCMLTSIAAQNDIYEWCRDHRVHHKFTETSADPHDIKRGFFFAHMGWLLCKKHPDVISKGKTVSMDDLMKDPVVRFHKRFYIPMMIMFCFVIPTYIPYWLWGENFWISFFVCGMTRYCVGLHITWTVNSAAHYMGDKPYNKYIEARQNTLVALIAQGEGWHNYHHVFPWDYAANEFGYTLNLTKAFIDLMEWLGQAYDLKRASTDAIQHRKQKTGDASSCKPEHHQMQPEAIKCD